MKKILNVAEKNAVAKQMAKILSKGKYTNIPSFAKYNMNYKFKYNIFDDNVTMIATSVAGHIYSIDFDQSLKLWSMDTIPRLFDAPLCYKVNDPQTDKIIKNLKLLAKECDTLIIWTDCDREGEYIGQSIVDVCLSSNRMLIVKRARFSEVTDSSLTNALRNLTDINQLEVDSVKCRIELDLRIGASFTRMQSLKCRNQLNNHQNSKGTIISYGPCQFPTLGLVVERYREIAKFIPEKFWKLELTHKLPDFNVNFIWERGHLFCQRTCNTLHHICKKVDFGTVVSVITKEVKKSKPYPMDTIKMEKMASTYLHMSSKMAMTLAEKLYTTGYISYPRTETTVFPPSINLKNLVEKQTNHSKWGTFARNLILTRISTKSGSKFDKAHPPIHPLKSGDELQGDSARLFELITRHFLACCSEDAIGLETTVQVDVNGEKFNTYGLNILQRNFLEVYPYIKWNENKIPLYTKNQILKPITIDKKEGETSPPSLLTESDLISLMEKHGIGTDATHAEHIAKIQERGYVELIKRHFVPKELGLALIEGYEAMGYDAIYSPALRASFEKKLVSICNGEAFKTNVVNEMVTKYKQLYSRVVENITVLITYIVEYTTGVKKIDQNILNRVKSLKNSVNNLPNSDRFSSNHTQNNKTYQLSSTSGTKKVVTCSICRTPGHTKRTCKKRPS